VCWRTLCCVLAENYGSYICFVCRSSAASCFGPSAALLQRPEQPEQYLATWTYLDLMPWRCLVGTRQQLFHARPPHSSVLCQLGSITQLKIQLVAILLDHVHPPLLLSAPSSLFSDMSIHCHIWVSLITHSGNMTKILQSSLLYADLVHRKSWLPWTDMVATERRTYIPYATFCSAWDCLPYMLLSVGLLLETGVCTAIIRPTSKCFSNRHCEFVCVPNYMSCVKTEVGLHSNDVSL